MTDQIQETNKQLVGWDFTLRRVKSDGTEYTKDDVYKMFRGICSKYVFQLEKSESGYEHYQGRIRLIKKQIKSTLLKNFKDIDLSNVPSFSPTTKDVYGSSSFSYVLKDDTRIDGAWSEKDFTDERLKEAQYIPRQYRFAYDKLYEWQKHIYDKCLDFDSRVINVLYDPVGNIGKSTLAGLLTIHKDGIIIPDIDDPARIVYSVCDILEAKKIRHTVPIMLDLPRSTNHRDIDNFTRAIEKIKSGIVYDTRGKYTQWYFDSPTIWIFCNECPHSSLLSKDRWITWQVTEDKKLVPFISDDEEQTPTVKVVKRDLRGDLKKVVKKIAKK